MAMMNGQQYRESLKKLRPNMYKWGKLIEDVTTNPSTKLHVDSVAHSYDMSFDEKMAPIFTTKSHITGETCHRWNSMPQTLADQIGNSDMKRQQYRFSGTCQGATCAGWTGLNVLWAVTFEMDRDLGTNYHEKLKKYYQYVLDNGLALAGAITDAKGDRSKNVVTTPNPDSNVHIKEVREDGIIIRGYKIQICGVAAAHEIIVVPGGGYKEEAKDYCMAVAVPRDVEGLTIVECTTGSSEADEKADSWDSPKVGNITQAYLLFDDVFVPNDRVFMCKEFKYSGKIISYFAAIYRAAIGACVAGQGDVMCGAAIAMARANGLSQKTFQSTLTEMAIKNEITYGLGIGAMAKGRQHPAGLWIPNDLLAHANKTQVGLLPYDVKVMCQNIGGGIVETGCMPPWEDFQSPIYGQKLLDAMAAGTDGESRVRIARLVQWLTIGGGIPGCMHGGGSPDGARMVVKAFTPWEDLFNDAIRIAGVKGVVAEPAK